MEMSNALRAEVLVHALPLIQKYNKKTVVIKYGGSAMVNETLKDAVMEDICLLRGGEKLCKIICIRYDLKIRLIRIFLCKFRLKGNDIINVCICYDNSRFRHCCILLI